MNAARRTVAWLIALPLAAAGIVLTRSLVPPPGEHPAGAHEHAAPQAQSVVAFLCSAPFLLSASAILALILAVRVVQTRRGLGSSAWPFAVLVPLGFLFYHHFEHLVGSPAAALGAPVGPELLLGLVLQLPFALLAYIVATALLRVADKLVGALASRRRQPVTAQAVHVPGRSLLPLPRVALIATEAAPRAPPLCA
jgi:hypothetical protein